MKPLHRSASLILLFGTNLLATSVLADPSVEQHLLDLSGRVLEAQRTFDQSALESMLASDYREISPVGDVDTRAEVIGFYSPEAKARMAGKAVPLIELSEPVGRILGDDATVIARETMLAPGSDATQTVAMRVLFHFHKANGQWLLQTSQYTALRKAAASK